MQEAWKRLNEVLESDVVLVHVLEAGCHSLSGIIDRTLGQFFEFRRIQKRLVPACRSRQDASANIWVGYACSASNTA
jgi:hypothetical protein